MTSIDSSIQVVIAVGTFSISRFNVETIEECVCLNDFPVDQISMQNTVDGNLTFVERIGDTVITAKRQ